jgi:hypothetical protein
VQESLPHAVAIAADRGMTTTSEYARRAIVNQLRADGVDPANPLQPRSDADVAKTDRPI